MVGVYAALSVAMVLIICDKIYVYYKVKIYDKKKKTELIELLNSKVEESAKVDINSEVPEMLKSFYSDIEGIMWKCLEFLETRDDDYASEVNDLANCILSWQGTIVLFSNVGVEVNIILLKAMEVATRVRDRSVSVDECKKLIENIDSLYKDLISEMV